MQSNPVFSRQFIALLSALECSNGCQLNISGAFQKLSRGEGDDGYQRLEEENEEGVMNPSQQELSESKGQEVPVCSGIGQRL